MTKAPRVPDYLSHILKAIERIARYTPAMDEAAFLNSCRIPDDCIDSRRYSLFIARAVLGGLAAHLRDLCAPASRP